MADPLEELPTALFPLICGYQEITVDQYSISLLISPHVPVLGFSWLQKHIPVIDWSTCSILGWSPFSHFLNVLVTGGQY
jgi:hypothetical protein